MHLSHADVVVGSKAQSFVAKSYVDMWTIPPGTTSVMIEGWGAGGAGGNATGGQGGGYFKAILPDILLKGGCQFRFDNGNSSAICQDSLTAPTVVLTLTASAGAVGGSSLAGSYSSSINPTTGPAYYFTGRQGQAGSSLKVQAMMMHAVVGTVSSMIASATGGDGGDSGGALGTKGSGGWTPWVMQNNGSVIRYAVGGPAASFLTCAPTPGVEPGGGGGALAGLDGKGTGAQGGPGRIIVTYCGSGGC